MKVDRESKAAIKAMTKGRPKAAVQRAFAVIRANADEDLIDAAAPAASRGRGGDPFAREIDGVLRPILARSAEKAELLVEHMARSHKTQLSMAPRGVADAVKRLRARFSDAQIRAGAESLLAELAKLYSTRETVA